MKIDQFPHQYEAQRNLEAANDVAAERERSESRQRSIRLAADSQWLGIISDLLYIIGIIVGFFVCCGVWVHNSLVVAIATWIATALAGFGLSMLIGSLSLARNNKKEKKADIEIANEQSRCEQAIQEINTQAAREIAAYKSEFETEARQLSVRYAESSLATEIIDRLTTSFASAIDAADRQSHITTIYVPFSFNVYTYKITCSSATYDFNTMRYAYLTGPLEQAAIARAIAAAVQLNITMQYPHDVSGTDFKLNISYTYLENHVSASITYTAQNGYYRAVQSW